MTDLEQAVIKAALDWGRNETSFTREVLEDAIDAYSESLKPDPWKLLEHMYAYHNHKGGMAMEDPRCKVHAALEWRRTHEE